MLRHILTPFETDEFKITIIISLLELWFPSQWTAFDIVEREVTVTERWC